MSPFCCRLLQNLKFFVIMDQISNAWSHIWTIIFTEKKRAGLHISITLLTQKPVTLLWIFYAIRNPLLPQPYRPIIDAPSPGQNRSRRIISEKGLKQDLWFWLWSGDVWRAFWWTYRMSRQPARTAENPHTWYQETQITRRDLWLFCVVMRNGREEFTIGKPLVGKKVKKVVHP